MTVKSLFKELFSKKRIFYVMFPKDGIEEIWLKLAVKIFAKEHFIVAKTIDDRYTPYMMFILPEYLYEEFVNSITLWDSLHDKISDNDPDWFIYSVMLYKSNTNEGI